MAVTTTKTNKPLNPRGNDQSPKGYNRAELYTGKALDFDGVNDSVNLTATNLDLQEFTIFQNVRLDGSATAHAFYSNYSSTNNVGVAVGLSDSTANKLKFYTKGSSADTLESSFALNDDEWYQVVATYDGATKKIYINGVLDSSVSYDDTIVYTSATPRVGALSNNIQYYDGEIAGVKVYSTALTAAQVADLYNNPEKIVPTGVADSALKLWLPMMEGAGTTCYDGSGNGNHGTISGATWTHGIGAPVSQTAVIDWNKGTNRSEYSEDLSQTAWAKTNISVSASATTAPDGSTNAWNAVPNTSNNIHLVQDGGYSVSSGNYYVASGWFKANGYDYALISFSGYGNWGGSNGAEVAFDLVNGTATPTGGAPHDYGIVEYPNGWYRCYTIGLANSTFSTNVNFFASDDGTSAAFVGDGTSGVLMWGLHSFISSEIGSYIPTLSTAQTSDVLLPQGLTTGRDITGVNLFENVRKQGALNLDGNSWAEVHDNASVDFADFTLECWVRFDKKTGTYQNFFSKGDSGSDRSFEMYLNTTETEFATNVFGTAVSWNTTTINTNQWYHVVCSFVDSTNEFNTYVDGSLNKSTSVSETQNNTDAPIIIGAWISKASSFVNGDIAQPRIYNRALTAEEVQRNYDAGKNIYK